jgi:NADH dehydrogenase FAD-containing subunit
MTSVASSESPVKPTPAIVPATTGPTKNLIVLGASYAGLGAAHYLLKHIVPALPSKESYHVFIVDPSETWFCRVAAPRGVVSEELLPMSKFMLPLGDAFAAYPKESYTLVQGKATNLNTTDRTVTLAYTNGNSAELSYHALIIATGASSPSPILGVQDNHLQSVSAIEAFRKALPNAKSIVIAGGGPAGVETAGEIGQFLNGTAGFFASRPKTIKTQITLITADDKLLPVLRPAIANKAKKLLDRVGVDVKYGTKVASTVPEFAGRLDAEGGLSTLLEHTTVTLTNGETIEADLFIPAYGLTPNTSWLPKDLLNAKGQLEVNAKTLRVDKAGAHVYAIGDVADYSKGGVMAMMDAHPTAMTNVKRDLVHAAADEKSGATGTSAEGKVITGKDREYADKFGESQLVPVGRSKGVGAIFGWKLPSFMVYMIKGRDYLSSTFPGTVKGDNVKKEAK